MAQQAVAARLLRRVAQIALAGSPWVIMVGSFLLFQAVRGAADDLGAEPLTTLGVVDRTLALGFLPSAVAQEAARAPLTRFAVAVHLTFFTLPLALGLAMTATPGRFARFAVALACAFAIGGLIHLLVPAAPPWLAEGGVAMLLAPEYAHELRLIADPNPYAAFPSMHVATASVSAYVIASRSRLAAVLYPPVMTAALVYLGEHYVVDCIAGALVGMLAWLAAGRITRDTRIDVAQPLAASVSALPGEEPPLEARRAA